MQTNGNVSRSLTGLVAAALWGVGLAGVGSCLFGASPADADSAARSEPGLRQTQGLGGTRFGGSCFEAAAAAQGIGGPGFGQGIGGPGFGQGIGGPGFGGPGFGGPGLGQGGTQGGGFPGGGRFGMAPGGEVRLAALCTDLFADPPRPEDRFTGGDGGLVVIAGSEIALPDALNQGLIELRGAPNRPMLLGRGSPDIYFTAINRTRRPAELLIPAGMTVVRAGSNNAPSTAEASALFAAARESGARDSLMMQLALWGLRGSNAEDVEQTALGPVRQQQVDRVMRILESAGSRAKFGERPGVYKKAWDAKRTALGEEAEEINGRTFLGADERVDFTGFRGEDGAGVARLTLSNGLVLYTDAKFSAKPRGKWAVQLTHLRSGRPLRLSQNGVLVNPTRS